MSDNNPQKRGEHAALLSVGDPRSVQAIINKVADGYTVTVSLKKDGRIRAEAIAPSTPTPRRRRWRGRSRHSRTSPGTRLRWS